MTRLLTSLEIEDVLSVIVSSSCKVYTEPDQTILNARESLRQQLVTVKLYPQVLPIFKKEVEKQYFASLLQPGEMVGIVAASSIGEQNTQASLNSFHQSGSFKANLTGGLARLSELMNATENTKTPSLTIFFNKDISQTIETVRHLAFTKLIYIDLECLLDQFEVVELEKPLESWYDFYQSFVDAEPFSGWCLQLFLNPNKLRKHQIKLKDVVRLISNNIDTYNRLRFAYSHESLGRLDLWMCGDIPDISTVLNLNATSKLTEIITEEKKNIYNINKVILPKILVVHLSGVNGLQECYYTEIAVPGTSGAKKEWRIDTKGGKLKDLFKVSCVDGARCKSNDMHEIKALFGIEAVKQMLREEFMLLSKVNLRHLELLIDSMTVTGNIQRVTRNGIDRKQVGTIAKASFEQPLENFLISASFGDKDPLKGVSASITVGKLAEVGTGFMEVINKSNIVEQVTNGLSDFLECEEAMEIEEEEEEIEEEEEDDIEEEDTGDFDDIDL